MMHRWYEEGLLHPDFMSVLLPTLDPKDSAKGEYGVFGAIYTWYDQFVEANDENFELVGMTPLKNGPDGEVHVGTLNPMVSPTGAIAADSEHIELICKWWDYLYGEEGIILGNWGIEGETYEVKENGEKTWIGPFLNPDNDPMFDLSLVQWQYLVYNTPGYTQVDREYCLVNDTALAFVDAWSDCGNDYNYPQSATMTADETEAYAAGFSDLDTYVNEMSMKFVIGDEDLAGWDSFIDTVNSMNVDELIGYKQAALDRYNKR